MYLLDTDWVIEVIGGRQPATQILDHLGDSRVHVCYITVGELYERAIWSANPDAYLVNFRHFLSKYRVLTLSDPIMERFAETRFFLRRRGQLILDLDLLIAATALHYDLTLLTRNLRDFQRIPALNIYQPR